MQGHGCQQRIQHLLQFFSICVLVLMLGIRSGYAQEIPPAIDGAEQFNPTSPIQGTGWANLYDPNTNNLILLPYLAIDEMAIFEGDIILGPVSYFENVAPISDPSLQQSVAIRSLGWRWIDGIVPYLVGTGFSGTQTNSIQAAMTHIEARTSIRFVARTSQSDYVKFDKVGGCSSYIGRQDGEQIITLGGSCADSLGVVVHELYHALGMFHEQSRSDRDSFVTINYANIQAGREHNFNIAAGAMDTEIGPYDYDSIMHYGRYGFSKNGLETISTPGNQAIGNRSGLSTEDIHGMQYIYYTNLQLSLTHPTDVSPGGSVAVVMNVENQGDNSIGDILAKDLTLTLPLPSQTVYQSFSSSQNWQCAQQGQNLFCTLAWLDRNANTSLTVNLTAPTSLNSLPLNPTVSASNRDIQSANNSRSSSVTVTNLTDLDVRLSTPNANAIINNPITINLDFTNTSQVDTQQVNLSLIAPTALGFTGYSGSGWNCSNATTTTSCQLSNLAQSASNRLTFNFVASAEVNQAAINVTVTTQATDGDLANNSANTLLTVGGIPAVVTAFNSSGSGSSSGGAIDFVALLSLAMLSLLGRFGRLSARLLLPQLRKIALLPLVLVLGACQFQNGSSQQILYVDSKQVECTGVMLQQCLLVKTSEEADWEYFYDSINGFEYETGYYYKLAVKTSKIENPPQDASAISYALVEVLEKRCIDC